MFRLVGSRDFTLHPIDFMDAGDLYGLSKMGGDSRSLMSLRVSIIGEEKGQNRSLLEWARSQAGKTVSGYTNHFWNGLTTLQLAKSMDQILTQGLYQAGLFHLHSPDSVTKNKLLRILSEVYHLQLNVVDQEAPQFCDRRLATVHSLARKVVDRTIEAQVIQMRDFG